MSRGTTSRAIRIGDDLWAAALAKADERSETVSEVVRRALELYAEDQHPTWGSEVSPKNNAHIANCPQCQQNFG